MNLSVVSVITENIKYADPKAGPYTATRGMNQLVIEDDEGSIIPIDCVEMEVTWMGHGSPYPTPPFTGGTLRYVSGHPRFGNCFRSRETARLMFSSIMQTSYQWDVLSFP